MCSAHRRSRQRQRHLKLLAPLLHLARDGGQLREGDEVKVGRIRQVPLLPHAQLRALIRADRPHALMHITQGSNTDVLLWASTVRYACESSFAGPCQVCHPLAVFSHTASGPHLLDLEGRALQQIGLILRLAQLPELGLELVLRRKLALPSGPRIHPCIVPACATLALGHCKGLASAACIAWPRPKDLHKGLMDMYCQHIPCKTCACAAVSIGTSDGIFVRCTLQSGV